MKKVAIITINDDYNCGNRLQNYAMQEVLEKHGVKAETIYNQKGIYGIKYKIKKVKDYIKRLVKGDKENLRHNEFIKFNKLIDSSKYAIDVEHIPNNIAKKYDYFIAGSDQIWNYTFKRMTNIDFLTFAPNEKRNSVSASIGVNQIPEELKTYYKKNLEGFNKISVREEQAKDIIEELTGRKDVEVLVDPTMMLTMDEWKKISKKPKEFKENEKYILNYFLGNLSEERKAEIQRVANEKKCKIINLLDKNDKFYISGPSEYLYLIEHAFLVCTDSFHSCVFSILYNKPFIIFEREDKEKDMNSRIETLFNKFELSNRRFENKIQANQLECDYNKTYEILEKERHKFNNFVERILKEKSKEENI